MFNSPHRRGRVLRTRSTSKIAATPRLRLVVTLVALLSFCAILAFNLAPRTGAQEKRGDYEAAFAAKADKVLQRVRKAAAEDRILAGRGMLKRETSQVDRLSRSVGVERNSENKVTVDLAVRLTEFSDESLKDAGFQIAARVGDIVTLQADVDRLPELAALESVGKIFAAVSLHPLNDRASQTVGIQDGTGQRTVSQTGRGVVVAVIDSGIDFRHLDFTVPGSNGRQTRIKAMLDMTVYESAAPDPGWNYTLPGQSAAIGHLYTEADINAALQLEKPADQNADIVKQRDKNGHGTHVTGTAAGNGIASLTPGTYTGMAPEADLIIVKASRQDNGDATFRTTDIINALQFVQQKAAELSEPFVINLSLGGQLGPHDGTSPEERAIDTLVNSGPGRTVCVAAGNDGNTGIHASAIVPAGGSLTLDFNVTGKAEFVDLYQAKSDRFSVTVTRPDGVTLGPVSYDPNGVLSQNGQASDEYLQIFNTNDNKGDTDPANDQPDIFLMFKTGAPTGTWKITLEDADGNSNLPFNAWSGGEGVYFNTYQENDVLLVASPGSARGAITVGAFVTRSANLAIGSPAPFTSPGPTADGRTKPEIGAPGSYLYSARSTDVTDENFGIVGNGSDAPADNTHYVGLAGTSMATPVTTGGVALLLQSNPDLSAEQTKRLLTDGARQDVYTQTNYVKFGYGKLDVAKSLNLASGGGREYTISGRVTGFNGAAIGGVELQLIGRFYRYATTDSDGYYSFPNQAAGYDYYLDIRPRNFTAAPQRYTFSNLRADQSANFSATLNIQGRVFNHNYNGLSGATVTLSGSQSMTLQADAGGGYVFTGLPARGSYTVTVSHPGLNFGPANQTFNDLREHAINADFREILPEVTISGRLTEPSGLPIPFALVDLMQGEGVTARVTSDAGGYYSFGTRTTADTFMVVPSRWTPHVFTPFHQTLTRPAGSLTINFTGTRSDGWEFTTLPNQVDTRVWTYQGRTYAYAKFLFPGSGYRVADWGYKVNAGNDFSVDTLIERFTGSSGQALKTTAQIYDLGPLAPGNYNFIFKNSGAVVKTLSFSVSADSPPANLIDDQRQFVRQQYLDFLNREPDGPGWDFWTGEITQCTTDPSKRLPGETEAQCIIRKRANTSAAFFLSPEFQNTGYFVLRVYRGSLGRMPYFGGSVPADNTKDEFTRDHTAVSAGIVVNNQLDQAVMYSNKQAFVNQFVTRADFQSIYGGLNDEQYVDKLFETTNVVPTSNERQALINGLSSGNETRASVLFKIVDGRIEDGVVVLQTRYGKLFYDQQLNPGFVQMEYFGYMKRDPDDDGYAFWLGKLNQYGGNFVDAQMVLAFISSPEYRARFGQP